MPDQDLHQHSALVEHSDAFLEALCRTAMERKYPLSHPDGQAAELRLAEELRSIGFAPLPSFTNFVLVPHERAQEIYEALLGQGLAVRPSPGAFRITVHRLDADDRLLEALAALS